MHNQVLNKEHDVVANGNVWASWQQIVLVWWRLFDLFDRCMEITYEKVYYVHYNDISYWFSFVQYYIWECNHSPILIISTNQLRVHWVVIYLFIFLHSYQRDFEDTRWRGDQTRLVPKQQWCLSWGSHSSYNPHAAWSYRYRNFPFYVKRGELKA